MMAKDACYATLLLVEDNPGDQKLVSLALRANPRVRHLHIVDDGDKAMSFLKRAGTYGEAPRPDLILLDLNIPRRDGCQVLREIRADESLSEIPVVVMTSSYSPQDVMRCYRSGANAFVTKPIELDEFFDMVNGIDQFWLQRAQLPQCEAT